MSKNRCHLAWSSASLRRSAKLARDDGCVVALEVLGILLRAATAGFGQKRRGCGFRFHKGTNGEADRFFQLLGSRDFTVASSASTSFLRITSISTAAIPSRSAGFFASVLRGKQHSFLQDGREFSSSSFTPTE
jgi:hypothetical protein